MMRSALLVALLSSACIDGAPALSETSQAMAVCADGPTTFGVDVSRYQGDINWSMVAGAGVKFAWIQVSRSLTDIDLKFAYNWQQARANGILRGAYQRFRPGMNVMGQAKLFVDKLGPVFEPGDLPPMLDVEDADGLSGSQIAAAVTQWMEYVEPRIGLRPIIYTGFYFWRDSVGGPDFTQHPLWVPNYSATCPLVPAHWTRWTFHQYSSTVTMAGITANTVDVNRFNGTLAELEALALQPSSCGNNSCDAMETADSCPTDCVKPGEPDPMEDPGPKDDGDPVAEPTGGCSTGGVCSPLILLAAGFVRRRNRRVHCRHGSSRGSDVDDPRRSER
jgi:lysozyme